MTKVYAGAQSQKKANEIADEVARHVLSKGYWNQDELKPIWHIGYGTICAVADILEERGILLRTSEKHRYYRVVEKREDYQPISDEEINDMLPPTIDPDKTNPSIAITPPAESPKKDYRFEYLKLKYKLSDDDLLDIMEVLEVQL